MEYLYKDEDEADWPEFFEAYKERFPLLVYITGGNYGETIYDDFCSDQIYQVQTYSNQRRVVAKAAKVYDRYIDIFLSIPISTEVKFCVLKGHKQVAEAPKTLSEIVKERPFPIPVKFAPDVSEIYVGTSREDVSSYATILLTREYTENFLLGNCVMNGQVCKGVTIAAISALISVAPVSGIKGKSAEFFRKHLSELQSTLTDVKYDRTVGNPSITKITPEGTGTGNILPNIFPPLLPVPEKPAETKELSDDSDDDRYEKPPEPTIGPKVPPRATDLPPKTFQVSSVDAKGTKKHYENAAIVHPIPKPKARKTPTKQQKGSAVKQNAPLVPKKQVANTATVLPQSPTLKPETPQSTGKKSSERGPLPEPNCPSVKTNELFSEADYMYMEDSSDMYETLSSVQPNTTDDDSKKGEKITPMEPRGVAASTEVTDKSKTSGAQEHLKGLSVEDIGGCLRKLRLDKYVERFADDMIDGVILSELTKEDLKEEYNFKTIEQIRLWKFIEEGYIPK